MYFIFYIYNDNPSYLSSNEVHVHVNDHWLLECADRQTKVKSINIGN